VRVAYHPAVQRDIKEAITTYRAISEKLADDFREELMNAIEYPRRNPESSHFAEELTIPSSKRVGAVVTFSRIN